MQPSFSIDPSTLANRPAIRDNYQYYSYQRFFVNSAHRVSTLITEDDRTTHSAENGVESVGRSSYDTGRNHSRKHDRLLAEARTDRVKDGGMMEINIKRLERREVDEDSLGTRNTYVVVEGDNEFVVDCLFHPHHGSSMNLHGKEGTLHIHAEDDTVVRQIVALGGGCALAIHEEVVEGLSPASLRAIMKAE